MFTQIFDHLMHNFDEIAYSVCPGAGGYDAAALLVLKVLV